MRLLRSSLKVALLAFTMSLLIACASDGKKAAQEVIDTYRRGNAEQTKELMIKYGDTLEGQDYLDFCEELERAGILY